MGCGKVVSRATPTLPLHPNLCTQIDCVEKTISSLTVDAPMVMRSVKTRTAARMMIQRFREAAELLAENVSWPLVVIGMPVGYCWGVGYFILDLEYSI